MANCSQSFVHGQLRQLEAQGWIELGYGSVRLREPQAMLASLAG